MKKYLCFLLYCVLVVGFAFSQQPRERLKSVKVSFITEQIELTPTEAEKFWPVYNAYDDAVVAIRRTEGKEVIEKYLFLDEISEAEAKEVLAKYLGIEKSLFTERKKLIQNLEGILSQKKIIKLLKAERDFKTEMIARFKERFNKRD